ncbi:SSI family serine proteinase inhibitor [Streptomyces sp. NPDC005017]|uniref:SSI family serine proteinase inhibitor n=1 Tax=Streptomyces sp. NPDC005017 TaxID=3364706 RepID=UPI0036983C0A
MSYVSSRALRRFAVAAGLSLAAFGTLSPTSSAAPAAPSPRVPPPVRHEDRPDHLTVTVQEGPERAARTYELDCHPGRGSHPDPAAACAALDRNTHWGEDPFAPVPGDSFCTMLYGGPATAHVTGTWAGRPVDARFDRSNGCEIERWDRFVPLLPAAGD